MAVFIAATNPLLILLAQRTGLRTDRQQAPQAPQIDVSLIPCSGKTGSHNCIESKSLNRPPRGDTAKEAS